MIKVIVIDDEKEVREHIKSKINELFKDDIMIIDEADSVESGVNSINNLKPDLLLLDIHLSDGNGFDILTRISHKDFDVIFITGFDYHAIKAIKVGALDYILKPVDEEEFKNAILKAVHNHKADYDLSKLIEISNEYFKGVEKKRVILKTTDTVYAIYEDDVLYCKSDGNYTTFYTQQLEKIVVSKSIKNILEILSEDTFVRCHQSYVVNKKHVLKYDKKGVLVINFDIQVPVSSRRKDYTIKKIFE